MKVTTPTAPQRGDFVRVRTRRWLVEDERSAGDGLTALHLACVDDDAQGEVIEVLWGAELDRSVLKDEGWASVAKLGLVEVTQRFVRILKSALERARLCSGDPVCADHDPATADEDRTLHGAACHGCLLVAETSCEARNLFLDRALMVDTMAQTGAGFF